MWDWNREHVDKVGEALVSVDSQLESSRVRTRRANGGPGLTWWRVWFSNRPFVGLGGSSALPVDSIGVGMRDASHATTKKMLIDTGIVGESRRMDGWMDQHDST